MFSLPEAAIVGRPLSVVRSKENTPLIRREWLQAYFLGVDPVWS